MRDDLRDILTSLNLARDFSVELQGKIKKYKGSHSDPLRFGDLLNHMRGRDFFVFLATEQTIRTCDLALLYTNSLCSWMEQGASLSQGQIDGVHGSTRVLFRKTTELLSYIILFRTTNRPNRFRHFLIHRELYFLSKQLNELASPGLSLPGFQKKQIPMLQRSIRSLDAQLLANPPWYAIARRRGIVTPRLQFNHSAKDHYKKALTIATDHEWVGLGFSYASFGSASRGAHPDLKLIPEITSIEMLSNDLRAICTPLLASVNGLAKLLQPMQSKQLEKIREIAKNSTFRKLRRTRTNPKLQPGDILFIFGYPTFVRRVFLNPDQASADIEFLRTPAAQHSEFLLNGTYPAQLFQAVLPEKQIESAVIRLGKAGGKDSKKVLPKSMSKRVRVLKKLVNLASMQEGTCPESLLKLFLTHQDELVKVVSSM